MGATQASRLAKLEAQLQSARVAFLKARPVPELQMHAKLIMLKVLADPGAWLWQQVAGHDEISLELAPDMGTPTDAEAQLIWAGFLLDYAREVWPLFGVPGAEARLLALVTEMTEGRFATLDAVYAAAVAVGQRYGLVDGSEERRYDAQNPSRTT